MIIALLVASNVLLAVTLYATVKGAAEMTRNLLGMTAFLSKLRERFPIEVASIEREMIADIMKLKEQFGNSEKRA